MTRGYKYWRRFFLVERLSGRKTRPLACCVWLQLRQRNSHGEAEANLHLAHTHGLCSLTQGLPKHTHTYTKLLSTIPIGAKRYCIENLPGGGGRRTFLWPTRGNTEGFIQVATSNNPVVARTSTLSVFTLTARRQLVSHRSMTPWSFKNVDHVCFVDVTTLHAHRSNGEKTTEELNHYEPSGYW